MSLVTPSKIRELQIKLYRKAKNEFPVQSHGTPGNGKAFMGISR